MDDFADFDRAIKLKPIFNRHKNTIHNLNCFCDERYGEEERKARSD